MNCEQNIKIDMLQMVNHDFGKQKYVASVKYIDIVACVENHTQQ